MPSSRRGCRRTLRRVFTRYALMGRSSRTGLLLASMMLAMLPHAGAAQDIYLCIDEQGHKTLTDVKGKNCTRQEVRLNLTVPAPRTSARPAASAPEPRPANFPRVDGETQRARDSDRKRVLEDELKSEEERLTKLRTEYNNGEPERRGDERNYALYQERVQRLQAEIQRGENNVASLKREIALLQRQ